MSTKSTIIKLNLMTFKAFCTTAAFLVLLCSCNDKQTTDPAQAALEKKIKEQVGEDAGINIFLFEKIDSTTFAEELADRKEAFNYKLEQDSRFLIEYSTKGLKRNAAKKTLAVRTDHRILAALDSIATVIEPYAAEVAYYDYHFSGKAVSKSGDTEFKDYYSCITPSGEVMCISPSSKGLHKSMGRILPGYSELFAGSSEDEGTTPEE